MKKIIILTLCALLSSLSIRAQQVILTSEGFVDANQPDKNYVILEFPGKSQQQLYDAFKTMVMSNYVSPKTVMSENSPISLTVHGVEDVTFSLLKNSFSYTVVFSFKESRVRIQPHFVSLKTETGADAVVFSNGKPRSVMKKTIAQCEQVINSIICKSKNALDTADQDW